MPSALSKKIPPPPKQPGTHTNVEVKDALHARALRRTIVITAVLFMLFACLAVVSSTAQEYQGPENVTSTPKAIVIVTRGLSPTTTQRALETNNAPFSSLLINTGGVSGTLKADYGDAAEGSMTSLVHLLTGNASAMPGQSTMLEAVHGPSFLRRLKLAGHKPVLLAPQAYWSDTTPKSAQCSRVGLLDSECSGTRCPAADAAAYCNAYRKYLSCEAAAQLHRDEISRGLAQTLTDGGDLLYIHIDSFRPDDSSSAPSVSRDIEQLSQINLFDAAIGKVALALAERTNATSENWLLMVVSDGDNDVREAPFGFAVYSRGGLVQLNAMPPEPRTTDVYPTLLRWFGESLTTEQQARVLGICSDGIHVENCPSATSTSAPKESE